MEPFLAIRHLENGVSRKGTRMFLKNWRSYAHRTFAVSSLAVAILAIGLNGEFSDSRQSSEDFESSNLSQRGAVSKNLKAIKIPQSLSVTPWLEKAISETSLAGLRDLSQGMTERLLLEAMMDDEIGTGSPFSNLSSFYPVALILSKGVKQYNRGTYRTSLFRGDEGYDLIVYEVIHDDGTHSSFMAYFDKENRQELEENVGPEQKSLYVVFNVFETKQTSYYNRYKNGNLEDHGSVQMVAARAGVSQRVSASVPFMAAANR